MKKYIYGFKKLLPNILLAMFIMLLVSALFGKECGVVGFILLFFQLMSKKTPFSNEKFIRSAIIMVVVTCVATLAELSTPLFILFSFVVPFSIVILTSDDYDPKGYFIYGLTYFLIQTAPAHSYLALPKNVAAILLGLSIIYLYDYISNKRNHQNYEQNLLLKGFQIIIQEASLLLDKKKIDVSVVPITTQLNNLLYKKINEKKGILNEKETRYFQTVLFLEKMENLWKQVETLKLLKKEQNRNYLQACKTLLEEVLKHQENDAIMIEKIEQFLEQNELTHAELNEDFRYTLKKLKHIIRGYEEAVTPKVSVQEYLSVKAIHVRNNLSLNTTQTRFAIRLSLALLVSTIIALLVNMQTGFERSYWLPITTYSLMLQFSEEENNKIKNYLLGTILGAVVFSVIFRYIPESLSLIFMMFAITLLFLMQNEVLRAVVGSQLALVLTSSMFTDFQIVMARVLLVVVAGLLTYIIDKTILRTNKVHLIRNQVSHLLQMDRRLLKELKRAIFSHSLKFRYLDELILETYLTESLIATLEKEQQASKQKTLTLEVLRYNRDFLLNVEQLITMFNTNVHLTYDNYRQVVTQIDEMDHVLEMTWYEWTTNQTNKPDQSIYQNKLNVKDETAYIENRFKNCAQNIEKIKTSLSLEK